MSTSFSPMRKPGPRNGGLGVWDFDKAVDWGHLFILTRPIFYTLNFFGNLTGNFGVAILILTLIVKALLFPIANKGFESMAKMKKLQPEIEKLRKRYSGDDEKMKLQQEMMALYKKEKMNPLAGLSCQFWFRCRSSTLFIQTFSLSRLRLRHEPFIALDQGLVGARPDDRSSTFLVSLPYDPTVDRLMIGMFLGIGVLAD